MTTTVWEITEKAVGLDTVFNNLEVEMNGMLGYKETVIY